MTGRWGRGKKNRLVNLSSVQYCDTLCVYFEINIRNLRPLLVLQILFSHYFIYHPVDILHYEKLVLVIETTEHKIQCLLHGLYINLIFPNVSGYKILRSRIIFYVCVRLYLASGLPRCPFVIVTDREPPF